MQSKKNFIFFLTLFILYSFISLGKTQAQQPVLAVYPKKEGNFLAESYKYQLLELALQKSGVPYILKLSKVTMPEERARRLIMVNRSEVTVMHAGTTKEFEEKLRPIRIPVYGGLLGYRLFLINKRDLPTFAKINSLKDLQKLIAGQGTNWADIKILRQAGLKVKEAPYPKLFALLEEGKIDYFPRGITEIYGELENSQVLYPNIAIEPHILLVYPFASFYFVSKENTRLYEAIYQGLKKAHADGSFIHFLRTHPSTAQMFSKAKLEQRTRIDIANPFLSEETKNIPKTFWFQPSWLETKVK